MKCKQNQTGFPPSRERQGNKQRAALRRAARSNYRRYPNYSPEIELLLLCIICDSPLRGIEDSNALPAGGQSAQECNAGPPLR
jgi:hypothetical protein